jgi:hypothetical protein
MTPFAIEQNSEKTDRVNTVSVESRFEHSSLDETLGCEQQKIHNLAPPTWL